MKTFLLFGGTQRGATLIWGYTEGYNFDLGVRKYQKVENPLSNVNCEIRLPDVKVVIRLTNVNCEIRLPDVKVVIGLTNVKVLIRLPDVKVVIRLQYLMLSVK
jgi:hypothetical protein